MATITPIEVLDHGFVALDAAEATDLSVVNSARVSFARRVDEMSEGDAKLIAFLMKNRHGTPFEHNLFRFHIKAPIFVAREWVKHRISSWNEWSARYSKLEPCFYVPDNIRTQVGKPGHYTFEPVDDETYQFARNLINMNGEAAWARYEAMLNEGVAKEVARIVLPLNIYTQWFWTCNARSLMNFLSLRNDEHAMFEIREYAKVVEELFAQEMPLTHGAFIANGRISP